MLERLALVAVETTGRDMLELPVVLIRIPLDVSRLDDHVRNYAAPVVPRRVPAQCRHSLRVPETALLRCLGDAPIVPVIWTLRVASCLDVLPIVRFADAELVARLELHWSAQ